MGQDLKARPETSREEVGPRVPDEEPGLEVLGGNEVEVGPAQARWVPVRVQLPPQAAAGLTERSNPIHFDIERIEAPGQPGRTIHEKSTFLVPR